jgi:hypothetical protein
MSSTSHFISKTVEDIREAFLEEIRPKGIRCIATLAIGIPRRDSLLRNIFPSINHQNL